MPIYEFYCPDCHTIFSFFSPRPDPAAQPGCPRCGRPELARQPSRFATLRHRGEEEPDALDALDDAKMEGAMESLMREMDGLENEDDPRAMARMMRRFSEVSGLEMGERMEEMVARMEAGEDPESLEQEMDETLDDDSLDELFQLRKAARERRARRPRVDDELYFL
jgi:putative FmdB family regulatory protein